MGGINRGGFLWLKILKTYLKKQRGRLFMRWGNNDIYKDGFWASEATIYMLKNAANEMKAKEIYEEMKHLKLRMSEIYNHIRGRVSKISEKTRTGDNIKDSLEELDFLSTLLGELFADPDETDAPNIMNMRDENIKNLSEKTKR